MLSPNPLGAWADDQLMALLRGTWAAGQIGINCRVAGDSIFPSHMIAQTRAVLDRYAENGGFYREVVFPECGHSPHIEKKDTFVAELIEHIRWATTYV